ncbi:hypothetical protein JCM8547_005295 [Rhodosporidiobolus lusitaniae]
MASSFHFSPSASNADGTLSSSPHQGSPPLASPIGTTPPASDPTRFSPQLDGPSPSSAASTTSDLPTPLFEGRPTSSSDGGSSSTRPVPPTRSASFKTDDIWGTSPTNSSSLANVTSRGLGNGGESSTLQRTARAASDGLLLSAAFGGGSFGNGGEGRAAGGVSSRLSSLGSDESVGEEQAFFREHQRRSLVDSASQRLTSSKGFLSSPPLPPPVAVPSSGSLAAHRGATSPFFQPPSFLSTTTSTTSSSSPIPPLPSLLSPTTQSPPLTAQSSSSPFPPLSNGEPGPPGSKGATLHLGDLDVWMDEAYVRECCALMGWDNVVNVKMSRGASPSSGYCFLTFPSAPEAARVLSRFNASPPLLMPRSGRTFKLNWGTGLPGLQPRWDGEFSVFVGDLAREVGESELMALFTPLFPSTKSAKVMCDPSTGLSRGYGFVRFTEESDMQRALLLGANTTSGLLLHGRTIRISEASGPGAGGVNGGNVSPPSAIEGAGMGHLRERTRTRSGGPGAGGEFAQQQQQQNSHQHQHSHNQQQQQQQPHLQQQQPPHLQQQQQQGGYFPPYPPPPPHLHHGPPPPPPHLVDGYDHPAYASPPLHVGTPGSSHFPNGGPNGAGPFSPYGPPPSLGGAPGGGGGMMSPPASSLSQHPLSGRGPLSPVDGMGPTRVRQPIPQGAVPPGGDPNNTTVFVGGLPACISEETLKSFFHHFGEITYCKIPAGKGCGFVQFVRRADAELAIAKMNDFPIHGKSRIRLSWGRSQGDKQVEHVRKLASALGVPFESVWRMVQGQDGSTIRQIASAVGSNGQGVSQGASQAVQQAVAVAAEQTSPSSQSQSGPNRMDLRAVATAAGLTESEVLDLVRAGGGSTSSVPTSGNGNSGSNSSNSTSNAGSDFFGDNHHRNGRTASSESTTPGAPGTGATSPSLKNGESGNPYSRVSPSSFSSAFSGPNGLPLSPPPSAGPGINHAQSFAAHQQSPFPPPPHAHAHAPLPSGAPAYPHSHSHSHSPSPYTQIRPESYQLSHPAQSPYERVDFADGGRTVSNGGAGGAGAGGAGQHYREQSFNPPMQGKWHGVGFDEQVHPGHYTTSPPPNGIEDGFAGLSLHQHQHQHHTQPRTLPPPLRHGFAPNAQAGEFFPNALASPGSGGGVPLPPVGGGGAGGDGGWGWTGAA